MIQNTVNKTLAELFSLDYPGSYYIPKYQRKYVWSKWNWEALFDDIVESKAGHFLGSIICINTEKDSHKPPRLELVDGQQRMTTISLFYLAIYTFLEENMPQYEDQEKNQDGQMNLFSLKQRLFFKENLRLSLSYINENHADYYWILSDNITGLNRAKKPKNLGNRRISKLFNYYQERLSEVGQNGEPLFTYDSALRLLDKLNSATIVKIDVANHADAFTLFETLNNRGVALSPIDIIKNKLLGYLKNSDDKTDMDQNFERWNEILLNLTDEYKTQERFLRQFYNAFRLEKAIDVEKAPKAIRSNLIAIYDTLIIRDVKGLFTRLEKAAELYNKNVVVNRDEYSVELTNALRDLANVNGADAYMLLLYVDHRFEIPEYEKIKLVKLLCRYIIRRNVTDSPPTRDLTNIFMDMIKELDSLDNYTYEALELIVLKNGRPSSDDFFEEKLRGDVYEENVGAVRYILSAIELDKSETKELYTDFYKRDRKKFVWTIEHIFPQGENIPKHWIDMVGQGDKLAAANIRKNSVHKLGNLTLTGYNSQLNNSSFVTKQNKQDKSGKYIGFKNGLWLNKPIRDIDIWDEASIIERTDVLVKEALRVFSLRTEKAGEILV